MKPFVKTQKKITDKVAENIYWVGTYWPEIQGSLNSFLLIDEKVALIDTGAIPTGGTILENIKKHIDPAKVEYIIATHSCVDHVGGLSTLLGAMKNVKIIGHPYLKLVLQMYYGHQVPFVPAPEGANISLGKMNLWFLPPMFLDSWDTLYVFEGENRVLFSADTFCNGPKEWTLFAKNDIKDEIRTFHTVKFPATLLGDRKKLLRAAQALKELKPKILASGHGLLLNKDISSYIDTMAEVL